MCKRRFSQITRKQLELEALPDSDEEEAVSLPGKVLETIEVEQRDQVGPCRAGLMLSCCTAGNTY